MSDMNEINDMMGRSYGLGEDIDEADLDAELAMLEEDLAADPLESGGMPDYLPTAPSAAVVPPLPAGVAEDPAPVAAGGGGGGGLDEFGLPMAP